MFFIKIKIGKFLFNFFEKIIIFKKTFYGIVSLISATKNPLFIFQNSLIVKGDLEIKGRLYGLRYSHIQVERNAKLILNENIHFSEGLSLRCINSITIDREVRIAPYCIISDCEYLNLGSKQVALAPKSIFIGEFSFLGTHSLICGETSIGAYCTIGPYSNIRSRNFKEKSFYTRNYNQ